MTTNEYGEAWVPVTTVIPRKLHRAAKAHCASRHLTLMEFVATAVAEKLRAEVSGYGAGSRRMPSGAVD